MNIRKYHCPYCNGRLFDFIPLKKDVFLTTHDCRLIIKCWKCRQNIVIKYEHLILP